MNTIAKNQCLDILSSFAWDSTGYEESSDIRAREREDSHIFYFRDWFNIVTDRGLREGRCFGIYRNGFAPKRDKFTEDGCVSLCWLSREFLESDETREKRRIEAEERGMSAEERKRRAEKRKQAEEEKRKQAENEKLLQLKKLENTESLLDTIDECLQSGENLIFIKGKEEDAQKLVDYFNYLEIEKRLNSVYNKGQDLSGKKQALDKKITTLENELSQISLQVLDLQEQLRKLQEQERALKAQQQEKQKQQTDLQAEQTNLQAEQKELQTEQTNLQAEQKALQDARDELMK